MSELRIKRLKAKDIVKIVSDGVLDDGCIGDLDQYRDFLEDVSKLICNHFGGSVDALQVDEPDMFVLIRMNECVPEDGGVYQNIPDASYEMLQNIKKRVNEDASGEYLNALTQLLIDSYMAESAKICGQGSEQVIEEIIKRKPLSDVLDIMERTCVN